MARDPSLSQSGAADTREDACELIRRHLDRGAPWDACDAFREQIVRFPGDAELLYWGALAHARAGAGRRAHALLDEAQAAPQSSTHPSSRLADILSLRGRLWKDAVHRAPRSAGAAAIAGRARDVYLSAYAISQDAYPGINAAALSMYTGDRVRARALAQEIVDRLDSHDAQTAPRSCWDHATAGEAQLLLGQFDRALESYGAAYALVPGDAGTIATMRRQLVLLQEVIPEAREVLAILPAVDVLAFAGHMIDASDRPEPRFPAALAPVVAAAIRERLARLHRPIVYSSAACGADLLFIEAAYDAGAEVNIVLPFDRDDFLRTSVAIGGDDWPRRFDLALSRASRVIMATEEAHLGDDVLFEHAAMLLEGLAALRASQLQTSASMLCVIDSAAAGKVGGTLASFERWRRNVGPPQVIDLRELRPGAAPSAMPTAAVPSAAMPNAAIPTTAMAAAAMPAATMAVSLPAPSPSAIDRTPRVAGRPQRTMKTMLFADFAGYSRLHDAFAPLFQQQFLEIGARQIETSVVKPLEAKTWGDALYVVFESPRDGAEFALRFLASMLGTDWTAAGLPDTSQIRVALHAGPVFRLLDPVVGRDSYFGASVTRAARIEPVTPPGMAYASEAFAATLVASGSHDFSLEYIGRLPLAKGYGESRIYRLDRK